MSTLRVPRTVVPFLFLAAWVLAGQAVALAFGQHQLVSVPKLGQSAISGCLTAMFAVGLVLVYRANRVINFAHAAVGGAAATLCMMLVIVEGWNYWLAAGVSILAAAVTGLLMQVLLVRRFSHAPRLVLTVVTICAGQLIGGIAGYLPRWMAGLVLPIAGPEDPPVPVEPIHSPLFGRSWEWSRGVVLRGDHGLAVLCALLVFAGIAAFFRYTNAGIAVRGAAENEDRAAMLGINPQTLSTVVWVIAAGVAGLAAVAQVSVQGATLSTLAAGIGGANLLRALTAAVLARMENLPVAVASSIGIALFERCVFEAFSQTALIDAFLLLAVVVALLAQRNRLARTEESVSGTWAATEEIRPIPGELRDLPAVRRGTRRLVLILVAVAIAYPWVMSPSQTNLGSVYAIFGIVGVSLVILTGWGGQISLGQFAFVAVGAAVGGSITGTLNLPFPVALLGGSLAGAALAIVLGLPALRIKGLYLAVTTLAFASATTTVMLNPRFFDWLLPESANIHRPQLLFIDTEDERAYYYFCVAFLMLVVVAALGLRRSRTGRVLIAMRDNERTAQSFGVNLMRTRLATFAISGFFAALAGVLYAHHQHAVAQTAFPLEKSLTMFTVAVIGGLGSVPGAVLGAIYLGTGSELVKGAAGQLLASGTGGLVVLLFFPGGLSGIAFSLRDAWLRRVAIRERIWVPSLLGEFRLFGDDARVPLAPKGENGDGEVPEKYRVKSRIGVAGQSQQGRGVAVLMRKRLAVITGGASAMPLLLLFGLNAVDELDRAAFYTLLPEIRDWFGVSLTTVLIAGTVSTLFGIAFVIPIGYLADRVNRLRLSAGGSATWALFSVLTGMAPNVPLLLGARFGSGASKTLEPAHASLLADYYPPSARGSVFAFYRAADSIGRGLGPLLAGFLASWFIWQVPFFLFAVPCVVLAFLVLTKLREPVRGEQERRAQGADEDVALTAEKPPSASESWRIARNVRTLRRIWFAVPFLIGVVQVLPAVTVLYLDEIWNVGVRTRGILATVEEPFFVAGLLVGGLVSNRLVTRRPGRVLVYTGVMGTLGAIGIALIAVAPALPIAIVLAWLVAFCLAVTTATPAAVITLVTPPRARAFALAVGAVFIIPGAFLVPAIVGPIGDGSGMRWGLFAIAPILLIGAAIVGSAAGGVDPDIRQAQAAAMASHRSAEAKRKGKAKLLVCRDVDVHYDAVQVLFGVDFDVEEGEIIALLGTNGAGKSTLLRAISGVTAPSNGAIFFDGDDITYLPSNAHAASGIIQVPGGKGVFPTLSVRENLRLAAWMFRDDDAYVAEATDRVLGFFPVLRERLDQAAGDLSGGEQQMLTLGQAFLSKPRLLMIDELSLGLAPAVVEQLLEIVGAIHDEGTTIILVEQSVNVALTVAERAVFMEKGEIRFTGSTAELMSRNDILRSVYLRGTAGSAAYRGSRRDDGAAGASGNGERPVVLDVQGVSKHYGGIAAVDGVDLALREGEIIGLIGPNGAGKTSLFDLITGFVAPDDGRILLFGEDITDLGPDARAKLGLHRSFQDARLFPALTVEETIAVALEKQLEVRSATMAALRLPNVRRAEARLAERADRLIRLMNLVPFRDKFVRELSTGSRRIVDLACVMAADPKVLLLDEPSSGIAQRETEELGPLLQRIKFETGCSILIIEHDMPLISAVSDELVALALGTVITRGAPDDVLDHPAVVESYLGTTEDVIQRSGSK